jgi:multidrug resistance efflux pump
MTRLETETLDAAVDAAEDARNRAKRKKWLISLGSTVLSTAIAYGLYSHYYGSKFISTDNPATGSRWCNACRCASSWTRLSWRRVRCRSACR